MIFSVKNVMADYFTQIRSADLRKQKAIIIKDFLRNAATAAMCKIAKYVKKITLQYSVNSILFPMYQNVYILLKNPQNH